MALPLLATDEKEYSVETREASPANFLMKIESFSLLTKHGIRKYESREFEAGDYKWKLIIYPAEGDETEKKGESEEEKKEEHVGVYLWAAGTSSKPEDWEANAIFTFLLHNQISDNYLSFRGVSRRFNAVNPKWGFPKLISRKILMDPSNGYLVDDSCVFGAEVFVIKRQRVVECLSLLHEPFKCDWKVSQSGDVWNSEVFVAGGLKWRVDLYRNGNTAAKGTHISIFMNCVDLESYVPHHKRVKTQIIFRIENYSKQLNHWFTSSSKTCGFDNFMSISDLSDASKRCRVYGCFSLEIEISVQAVVLDSAKI